MASQSRDKKRKTISPTENTNKRPKTTAGGHDPEIFYRIKDIIGESKRKYLIDWEDNPSTGDSYEPSWEPKANANAEAVADWEARKRGKRKGRLRPSISNFPSNTPSEATASDRTILAKRTPVRSPRFLLRKSISRLPDQKNVFGSSVVDCLFAQSEAPGSELSPSIPHTVERRSERRSQHVLPFVVQVSQRPDFDPRLQYSQYISPLPAPDATAQLTSPQNRQEASVPVIFDREGIIPNSQSLPGSSSYLSPTPSETESKSSSPSGSARASSDLSYPTTLEELVSFTASTGASVAVASDPIEDFSSPVAPLGGKKGHRSSLSRTTPPPGSIGISNSTGSARVTKDATPVKDHQDSDTIVGRSTEQSAVRESTWFTASEPLSDTFELSLRRNGPRHAVEDSASASSRLLSGPQPQSSSDNSAPAAQVVDSSQFLPSVVGLSGFPVEIPASSSTRSGHLANIGQQTSSILGSVFQTQVPLHFGSISEEADCQQTQPLEDPESAEDRPIPETSISELGAVDISSQPTTCPTEQSTSIVGELWQGGQVVQPEEQSGSASATPQHREQSSQETVATAKSSILSQRNPNSVRAPSSAPSAPPTNVLGTEKSCLENRVVTQPDQVLQSIESDLQEDFAATSTQRDTSTSLLSPALSQSPPSYETLLIPNHSSPPVDMSESSSALIGSTGLSLKNQLRQMRAAAAAARQGEWEAQPERPTKSPSTIPDGGPPLPVEESLLKGSLSLRAPNAAEGGHVSISSAPVVKGIVPKAMSQIIAGTVSSTVDPTPGNQEFIVPLPMDARIRDQYQEIITSYRGQVESFTHAADAQDPSLVRAMEEMIQRVKKVTVHPDLENAGTISHRQAPEYEEAKWAENSSSKFLFMRHLFDALRHQEEHIAVLARPGQTLDILEAFLKGNGIGYERPDRHSRSEGRSTDLMRVTLLPTGEEGGAFMVNRASAVIALDDTFAAEDRQVRDLREHLLNVGQQSPVLSLVVVQSAEHIERCVPDSLEDEERLQMLVSCIGQTMHEVGQLPPEAASPKAAAQEVATFLMGVGATNDAPWPLPLLGEISTMEFLTESQSSEESAGGAETRLEDLLAPQRVTISMPRTQKRSLSSEANDNGSSKRVRLTPTPTPEEGEITHVSDSVDRQSHGATGTTTTRPAAETAAAMRETDRGRLETQFLAQGEEEKRLRARLRDHVKALEAVQYRYEDLVEKYRGVRKERDEAQAAVVQADRRRELVSDELNTVKEHRSRLEGELSVARAALESSALPEVAELEKARSAALQSATEVEHLQQRLQSMVRDFEFTRAQYQEASTAAAEASTELETLRQENAVLQRKASGEAVRLREVAAAGGDERHISRIRQLELTLAEREEQLRRREEEAKTGGGRGRGVSTRAGSVPRGSPMPSASRAGSPSAVAATAGPAGGSGRVGHPLRHDQSA